MQCFICVTYMIIFCSAHPTKEKELADPHQKRSLFRDVIESFRIRAQLPENLNQNIENNIGQNYERYGYENELPQLPSDADFIPRRNDRIEMPPLKYRFPKALQDDKPDKVNNVTREEVVIFIDTNENKVPKTTQKPKNQKRPQLYGVRNKVANKNKQNEEGVEEETTQVPESFIPMSNTMTGQSQIGNRESQTVVKPTVIVNFRGSLSHRDSDIKLESRSANDTVDSAQNIFNINQEVNLETKKENMPRHVTKTKEADIKQRLSISSEKVKPKAEEDMLMCETSSWNQKDAKRNERNIDNVVQILFSV